MSESDADTVDLEGLGYTKFQISCMCAVLFIFDIFINVDHGAIPAGIKEM
jgi:hypothetical protein